MSAPRVFLDTCVLYPPHLRGFVLELGARGRIEPKWSRAVLAEWAHLVARRHPADAAALDAVIARMAARFPDALTPDGDAAHLALPDRGDLHVLAGALAGGAETILTLNLRDFPRATLAAEGVVARAPDDLAMALWLQEGASVEAAVAAVWPGLAGRDLRGALRRADLWRLGRALAEG
jgi:hypothetical protein